MVSVERDPLASLDELFTASTPHLSAAARPEWHFVIYVVTS